MTQLDASNDAHVPSRCYESRYTTRIDEWMEQEIASTVAWKVVFSGPLNLHMAKMLRLNNQHGNELPFIQQLYSRVLLRSSRSTRNSSIISFLVGSWKRQNS